MRVLLKRILWGLGVSSLIGILAGASLLTATWLEHRAPIELPKPRGPFAVGRTTFHWVMSGQVDELAPVSGSPRELFVWVWYPAAPGSGAPAEYFPLPWREALARNGGTLMSDFLTRDLSRVEVHARENADLATDQPSYPVVILRAGLAAPVNFYTVLAEDLASHGYIVVSPDAAYRTAVVVFPDGRTVLRPPAYNLELLPQSRQVSFATRLAKMWAADLGSVVDKLTELNADAASRFAGHLDLQHLGVLGHSLGGATAAYFCHDDPRCKAGIDLDGQLLGPVIKDGLHQPFMLVLEDHHQVADTAAILADFRSLYSLLPHETRLKISLAGSNHFSFSDQILLKSQILLGMMRRLGAIGGLQGPRGLEITNSYVSSFFDVHLKGRPRNALEALAKRYPEVAIE